MDLHLLLFLPLLVGMIALSWSKLLAGTALLFWAAIECCINEALGSSLGNDSALHDVSHGVSGSGSSPSWDDPSYSVFLFLGDLLLLLWMWGVSVQVWRRCGIPWDALLGLQSSPLAQIKDTPENAVYGSALDLSIVYLSAFIVFNWVNRGSSSGGNSGSSSSSSSPDPALYGAAGQGTGLVLDQRVTPSALEAKALNAAPYDPYAYDASVGGELGFRHALPPALLAFFAFKVRPPHMCLCLCLRLCLCLCLYLTPINPLFPPRPPKKGAHALGA